MNIPFDKKIIILTGGAKGIGGIVKALVAENAVPLIVGRFQSLIRPSIKAGSKHLKILKKN